MNGQKVTARRRWKLEMKIEVASDELNGRGEGENMDKRIMRMKNYYGSGDCCDTSWNI